MENIDWDKFFVDMKKSPVDIHMNQKTYEAVVEKDVKMLSLNIKINNHIRDNEALLVERYGKVNTLKFYRREDWSGG